MKKDLDDRLLPNNEYRDAENVAVSRSEGSDVGALEAILGNKQINVTGASGNKIKRIKAVKARIATPKLPTRL